MATLTHEAPTVKANTLAALFEARVHAGLCAACGDTGTDWTGARCHACNHWVPAEAVDEVHPADREFWAEHCDDDDADFGRAVESALGYLPEDAAGWEDERARLVWEQADRGEALVGHDLA